MVDIQYSITIMGGREVSRPYQVWFFAEGDLFFMFLFQSPSIFPLNRFIRLHGDACNIKPNLFYYLCIVKVKQVPALVNGNNK